MFVSDVAFIQYDKYNSTLDYYETQVPPSFRGDGIAQILAKVNYFINAWLVGHFNNTSCCLVFADYIVLKWAWLENWVLRNRVVQACFKALPEFGF